MSGDPGNEYLKHKSEANCAFHPYLNDPNDKGMLVTMLMVSFRAQAWTGKDFT